MMLSYSKVQAIREDPLEVCTGEKRRAGENVDKGMSSLWHTDVVGTVRVAGRDLVSRPQLFKGWMTLSTDNVYCR